MAFILIITFMLYSNVVGNKLKVNKVVIVDQQTTSYYKI